jgi:hypothetical protein
MTLRELSKAISDKNHPNVPLHCRPNKPLSDSSANALTKAIIAYFDYKGIKAWREASEGRYLKGKEYTDMFGRKKEEKGMYIPRASSNKGAGDIMAVIPPHGKMLSVEVKHGKDYQKPDQKEFQKELESMGGIYIIVKTWQDFEFQINKLGI